jgi:1-acyl-sn-glycerol-3-phosphate acyltransferase
MTAMLLPFYAVGVAFHRRLAGAAARLWHLGCIRLCGISVRVVGAPVADGPMLYVANHVSYLDIPVLGSLVDATFVAKSDVVHWPVLGFLARLDGTLFVRRHPRHAEKDARRLSRRLARGGSLIVFPEGTSTDGRVALPFKSALFGAIGRETQPDPWVQPVSVAYVRYADGRRLMGALNDCYAWYGEMTLVDHLFGVFGLAGAIVEVRFHPPERASRFADRKRLARHCWLAVMAGVADSHHLADAEEVPNVVPLAV